MGIIAKSCMVMRSDIEIQTINCGAWVNSLLDLICSSPPRGLNLRINAALAMSCGTNRSRNQTRNIDHYFGLGLFVYLYQHDYLLSGVVIIAFYNK
jgi:hypothetical protein